MPQKGRVKITRAVSRELKIRVKRMGEEKAASAGSLEVGEVCWYYSLSPMYVVESSNNRRIINHVSFLQSH